MSDILIYLSIGIVAFWLGKHFATLKYLHHLSTDPDRFITMLEEIKRINAECDRGLAELDMDDAIMLNTEERAGLVYLFQSIDDKFIAQGKSIEDALKSASERFPGKKFWIPKVKKDSQTA